MALWKNFIVLFGGFYDPGIRSKRSDFLTMSVSPEYASILEANYLNDLWLFDTQEYTWRQVEFRDTDRKPSSVLICSILSLSLSIFFLIGLEVVSPSFPFWTALFFMASLFPLINHIDHSLFLRRLLQRICQR